MLRERNRKRVATRLVPRLQMGTRTAEHVLGNRSAGSPIPTKESLVKLTNRLLPVVRREGCNRDIGVVYWHLRHRDETQLRNYIQELPLALAHAAMAPALARRIARVAAALPRIIQRTCRGLEGRRLR